MAPNFTLAGPADTDTLLGLLAEFYAIEHLTFDAAVARQALQEILAERRYGLIYLIEVADAIAGYVVLTFGFSLEFHGRDAWIDELYLRAAYRGQGIGKATLAFIAATCRSEGISAVHLAVAHRNQRAQKVYQNAGYEAHDRHIMTQWLI
ncbi:GNAT family N-acetyltransferase [Trichothermofontia sp.]